MNNFVGTRVDIDLTSWEKLLCVVRLGTRVDIDLISWEK